MAIHFFQEDISFNLPQKIKTKKWLNQIALEEGFRITELNYIFCSDEYLHAINVDYLNHDTYTDIITFDNSDQEDIIEGDIFISIDRIRENAELQKQNFQDELLRVLSHGLYHLSGYKDKLEQEIKIMRSKEDFAIDKFKVMQ
ncbi:MAG TPA: rRNA maturation RNase YbeY [Cyclobacteriaceae bacterium]|nr:rRNA maturation RNase YbeY [Cyclobacteriaceae bacterium]